jgi:hypothetical protein
MKLIPLTHGYFAKVSDCDYVFLRQFKWSINGRPEDPYAQARVDGKTVRMHRVVARRAGYANCKQTDHKNGNGLDNTRRNLRPATCQQNQRNRRRTKALSRVIGVYQGKAGHWFARVVVDGKAICLGTFPTVREAARARKQGEKKYFGRFAPND